MPAWKPRSKVEERIVDRDLVVFTALDPASSRRKRHFCYLLRTARGNVMVHAPDVAAFYRTHGERLDALGGVQWLYLTHHGDASAAASAVLERWGATLYVHAADAQAASTEIGCAAPDGFAGPHAFDESIELVTFPGHTPGYSCLIRRHGTARYLFSGHLIIESRLAWHAAASRRGFVESVDSVRRLASLDVDYLMPSHTWGDATGANEFPLPFGAAVRRAAVDSAVAYLLGKARRAR